MSAEASELAAALHTLRPAANVEFRKLTSDGRSWILYAKRWWPLQDLSSTWQARPAEPSYGNIMGKAVAFPRRTTAYGSDYKYSGQTQRALPMKTAPHAVRDLVTSLCSLKMLTNHNAALVNYYDAHAKDYIGAHSDDEKELVAGKPVISLSWCSAGHYRRFRFTVKKGVADGLRPDWGEGAGVIKLHDGDLVIMGGLCQKTHKHEIMKPTRALGESAGQRINVTLRAFHETPAQDVASPSRKRQRAEAQMLPTRRSPRSVASRKPTPYGSTLR